MLRAGVLFAAARLCAGHGSLVQPASFLDPDSKCGKIGKCDHNTNEHLGCKLFPAPGETENAQQCAPEWYSNYTFIPGAPTIPADSPLITQHQGILGDWTKKMPWRAPGTAPVFSPCGIDGGNPDGCPPGNPAGSGCLVGGYGHGPDGRKFAGNSNPEVWKAGEVVEIAWQITANHGGGYQYRLCKLPNGTGPEHSRSLLTEECFQQTPLPFYGQTTWIHYDDGVKNPQTGGTGGRASFQNMQTNVGTHPPGSTWMRNPVPGCTNPAEPRKNGNNGICTGPQFTPVLKRLYGFSCSGVYSQFKFPCHQIVDKIVVPADLVDGDYVVSLRYDCEQTSQVWNSCGDVRISGKAPPIQKYVCGSGGCVADSSGKMDKDTCDKMCAGPAPAPPAQTYACTDNTCVADPVGVPLATCQAVCHNEA